MIKERTDYVLPKICSRIATELDRTDGAPRQPFLVMKPRPKHQEYLVVGILWFNRRVDMDGPIDVFLVPKTMDQHHWDGDRLFGQDLIHGLALPKRIVGRM